MGFHRRRAKPYFRSSSTGNVNIIHFLKPLELWNQIRTAGSNRASCMVVSAWVCRAFQNSLTLFPQVSTAFRKITTVLVVHP